MELTIKIDLGDVFNEDGGEYSVKKIIENEVAYQVKQKFQAQIMAAARKVADKIAQEKFEEACIGRVGDMIQEIINSENIENLGYIRDGSAPMTYRDYIIHQMRQPGIWRSMEVHIDNIAKRSADETKKSYDGLFASRVVQGLEKQGLLKEGVLQGLMEDKS